MALSFTCEEAKKVNCCYRKQKDQKHLSRNSSDSQVILTYIFKRKENRNAVLSYFSFAFKTAVAAHKKTEKANTCTVLENHNNSRALILEIDSIQGYNLPKI